MTIQKYQNFLANDPKDQFIGKKKTTKNEIKNTTNEYRYFLKPKFVKANRFFVLIYSNIVENERRYNALKKYLAKLFIKNYNTIKNRKEIINQPIDSDEKWYKEIKN